MRYDNEIMNGGGSGGARADNHDLCAGVQRIESELQELRAQVREQQQEIHLMAEQVTTSNLQFAVAQVIKRWSTELAGRLFKIGLLLLAVNSMLQHLFWPAVDWLGWR